MVAASMAPLPSASCMPTEWIGGSRSPNARSRCRNGARLATGTEHVARSSDGVDQRRREAAIDFAAQAADLHIDDVGLRIEMAVPHCFEQHGAGDDLALVAHQISEQAQ